MEQSFHFRGSLYIGWLFLSGAVYWTGASYSLGDLVDMVSRCVMMGVADRCTMRWLMVGHPPWQHLPLNIF